MKRKIAIAFAALLVATSLSACNGKGTLDVEIPEFAETVGISFSAYSGPTVENWSGGSGNVNTITDEHFQKFVDAGFTHLLAVHEGARVRANTKEYVDEDGNIRYDATETVKESARRAEEDALRVLELAEKYGIKYYVRDWAFYDMNNTETWGGLSNRKMRRDEDKRKMMKKVRRKKRRSKTFQRKKGLVR